MNLTEKKKNSLLNNTKWQNAKEIYGTIQTLETLSGQLLNDRLYKENDNEFMELLEKLDKIAYEKENFETIEKLEVIFDNVLYTDSEYYSSKAFDLKDENEYFEVKVANYVNDSIVIRYEFRNSFIKSEKELVELFEKNLKIENFSEYDCTGRYYSQLQYYQLAKGIYDRHIIYDVQYLDI